MKKSQQEVRNQNHNFSEFDIAIDTWLEIRDDFILPFRFDIANVNFKEYTNYNIKYERKDKEIIIDKTPNPYFEKLIESRVKSETIKFLQHLNTNDDLFDEGNLFEHFEVMNHKELFKKLCDIGFTDYDFIQIKNFVIMNINLLTEIFIKRATDYLILDSKKKSNRVVTSTPSNNGIKFSDYDTETSQTYIKLQSIIEYQTRPIFQENWNKAYSEWSWREQQIRLMFLMRKDFIESQIEKYKSDSMPKMDDNKQK